MIPGTKIIIDNAEYVVPPLTLGQLRNGVNDLMKRHDELVNEDGKLFELFDLRGQVILAAIKRNHPDMTEETLFNYLDLANLTPLWLQVLGQSGFTPGENPAAANVADGTSNQSTAV